METLHGVTRAIEHLEQLRKDAPTKYNELFASSGCLFCNPLFMDVEAKHEEFNEDVQVVIDELTRAQRFLKGL